MTLFVSDPDLDVFLGDAVESLREIPDGTFQTAVTSPPFFGLRDYGTGEWVGGDPECDHKPRRWSGRVSGDHQQSGHASAEDRHARRACRCGATREGDRQIGLEDSLEEWVARLVEVFREVRRTLRPDGTLWLECGDSYAGAGGPGNADFNERWYGRTSRKTAKESGRKPDATRATSRRTVGGVKPKDLLLAPFELALALRDDGWWLRSTIIWEKTNAMPESAKDRPTTGHSYVFLLSPSARYFYDGDAIAEPAEWSRWGDQGRNKYTEHDSKGRMVESLTREEIARRFGGGRQRGKGRTGAYKTTDERSARFQGSVELGPINDPLEQDGLFEVDDAAPLDERYVAISDHSRDLETGRSKGTAGDGRASGTVRREGYEAIVENGDGALRNARTVWTIPTEPNRLAVCSVCEAFWDGDHPDEHCGVDVVEHFAAFPRELARRAILAGSKPGDRVLDPFGGSGTTAIVARALGRSATLVELRPEYAVMIRERTRQQSLLDSIRAEA